MRQVIRRALVAACAYLRDFTRNAHRRANHLRGREASPDSWPLYSHRNACSADRVTLVFGTSEKSMPRTSLEVPRLPGRYIAPTRGATNLLQWAATDGYPHPTPHTRGLLPWRKVRKFRERSFEVRREQRRVRRDGLRHRGRSRQSRRQVIGSATAPPPAFSLR